MNETYIEIDGVSYPDRGSYLAHELCGMCPCGMWYSIAPDIETILAALLKHTQDEDADWTAAHNTGLDKKYAELIFHVLDAARLTEHGGSVPGWLTERGYQVIENLKKFPPYEN